MLSVIDGVWTISVLQADLARKELARALIQRPQGSRPVTLVGYSMGARVIFSCLCVV
jgi:surfactin synthase thioesterase subunit